MENRVILHQHIEEGIQDNQQLKNHAARVEIAVQNSLIEGADATPELSAFFQGSRQRRGSVTDSYGMGLDSAWELDILGKLVGSAPDTDRVPSAFVEAENSLEFEQRLKEQQHFLEQASDDSSRAENIAFEQ